MQGGSKELDSFLKQWKYSLNNSITMEFDAKMTGFAYAYRVLNVVVKGHFDCDSRIPHATTVSLSHHKKRNLW